MRPHTFYNYSLRPYVKSWHVLTIWAHILSHNYSIVQMQAVLPHHKRWFFKPYHPKFFSVLVMPKRNDRFG